MDGVYLIKGGDAASQHQATVRPGFALRFHRWPECSGPQAQAAAAAVLCKRLLVSCALPDSEFQMAVALGRREREPAWNSLQGSLIKKGLELHFVGSSALYPPLPLICLGTGILSPVGLHWGPF